MDICKKKSEWNVSIVEVGTYLFLGEIGKHEFTDFFI